MSTSTTKVISLLMIRSVVLRRKIKQRLSRIMVLLPPPLFRSSMPVLCMPKNLKIWQSKLESEKLASNLPQLKIIKLKNLILSRRTLLIKYSAELKILVLTTMKMLKRKMIKQNSHKILLNKYTKPKRKKSKSSRQQQKKIWWRNKWSQKLS